MACPCSMKKYLPSLDELIPGVVIVVVGLLIYEFVGKSLVDTVNKVKAKVG